MNASDPEDPIPPVCPHVQRLMLGICRQQRKSGRRKMIRLPNRNISLITIFIVAFLLEPVIGKKVILLDTRSTHDELNWRTYSKSTSDGWLEESFMSEGGSEEVNKRAYVVCEVSNKVVDNWVRTPYIPRGQANRVFVQVNFTMRDCREFPRDLRTCRETINLLYHETDAEPNEDNPPPWEISDKGFKQMSPRLSGDPNRFDQRDAENIAIRSIEVTKKGIYFAFRDEGACASIMGVTIYYEVCEELVHDFAWYPETPGGPQMTSLTSVVGKCVQHAKSVGVVPPRYHCKVDGTWDVANGGCKCDPGHWGDVARNSQKCNACSPGTYSNGTSDKMSCKPCPQNSNAPLKGSAECECDPGYFRAKDEPITAPCSRPPSKPQNVQVEALTFNSFSLVWQRPKSDGGRKEIWYRIQCKECPPTTQYSPGTNRISQTRVSFRGLEPEREYSVFIFAENDVSEMKPTRPMYAIVDVRTRQITKMEVRAFRAESVSENEVVLVWEPPLMPRESPEGNPPGRYVDINGNEDSSAPLRFAPVNHYQLRKFSKRRARNNNITSVSNSNQKTFTNLEPGQEYGFQIRAKTLGFYGSWSDVVWVTTDKGNSVFHMDGISNEISTEQPSNPGKGDMTVTVAIIVGGVIVLALFAFICLLIFLFRRGTYRKKQQSDLDVLDYKNGGNVSPEYPQPHYSFVGNSPMNGKITAPLMSNMSPHIPTGIKPYVDPLTYEDPNRALQDFALEIDPNHVYISEIIGAGEFGEVCKGELKVPGRTIQTVAIKTLKSGSPHKARSDFLLEASIQGQFEHPNVISLRGVVTKSEPVMIVTEFMENGSLDAFLKMREGQIDTIHLISMMRDVAAGMKYLSEKGFVHRDLAARNVLVDREFNCKIADFGLSRGLEGSTEQVYTTKGGKIPVRWTAPEGISFRKFTSASDVWSFGVLMWEVVSYGERPYWDWSNQQVIESVEKGYRLPPPEGPNYSCAPGLYAVMLECWQADKMRRPTFDILLRRLHDFLRTPDLLYETPSTSPSSMSTPLDLSHSAVNLPSLSIGSHHDDFELGNFLRQVGTSHCFEPLVANGVTSLGQLSALTIVDLMNYGLTNSDASAILDSLRHAQQQSSTLPRNREGSFPNGYCRTVGTTGRQSSTRPLPRLHNSNNNGVRPSHHHHHQQQNEGFFV